MTNKRRIRFDVEQEDNIAFGNIGLIDNSPSGEPNAEVWRAENRLSKQPFKKYKAIQFLIVVGMEDRARINWTEKEDPVTQIDLLDSEDDQVKELIFCFSNLPYIFYRERLANRLFTLFKDAKEEDPDSLGIVAGSLRDFYNFLQLHPHLKYPSITLSPDNNILATWRSKQGQVFNVHFLSNKDVRFVISKPNNKYPERKFRFYGVATIDTLVEEVISSGVKDWISE